MPITFWRYGRASDDKQVMTPAVQEERTLMEFKHQMATGQLPPDAIDGGFICDKDTSRLIPFLERRGGQHLAERAVSGDRICVAAYDRLLGSPVDCANTLRWSLEHEVNLVIMDLRVDTSTNHGRMIAHIIAAVKENEVMELRRRTKEALAWRRSNGRPVGDAPIGYKSVTITSLGGTRMKWYFPWPEERQYCSRILLMHEGLGMTMREIGARFVKEGIVKPRTGNVIGDHSNIARSYRAARDGYPLRGGVQWKPPPFQFKIDGQDDVVDLIADCA